MSAFFMPTGAYSQHKRQFSGGKSSYFGIITVDIALLHMI